MIVRAGHGMVIGREIGAGTLEKARHRARWIGLIGKRQKVQKLPERRHGRGHLLSKLLSRRIAVDGAKGPQTIAFVHAKEEQLVADGRAAYRAPELIENQRRFDGQELIARAYVLRLII